MRHLGGGCCVSFRTLSSLHFLAFRSNLGKMAGPKAGRSGIVAWMSGIRTTMANDPGRQLLEDQIQSTGFVFLEDYLDNILAGPSHEYAYCLDRCALTLMSAFSPIIELVKTPGRRKIAQNKAKGATSKKKDKLQSIRYLDVCHISSWRLNKHTTKGFIRMMLLERRTKHPTRRHQSTRYTRLSYSQSKRTASKKMASQGSPPSLPLRRRSAGRQRSLGRSRCSDL